MHVRGDREAHARLDAAIVAAEARTDAEVLVAIARSSGSYRDTDHVAAAVVAAVAVMVMLSVHMGGLEVPDEWVVAPAVAAYVATFVLSRRTFFLRRLFTRSARRSAQVKRAAHAAFVEEGIHATAARNGILFYFSDLEDGVEIVADHGVRGRVDDATWNAIGRRLEEAARRDALAAAVVEALSGVTDLLAKRIPRTGEKKTDEVARRIRVRA